jgi:formylmethanofuran dehydrogenase subunit E
MGTQISPELIQATTDFHGHWCPGLAIGIRAAEWALQEMGKAGDEEIVAVVETDMCGVDAIQFMTGCTFGKGNLIHRDYGKNAFTFYCRGDQKAMRLVTRPDIFDEDRKELIKLQAKRQQQELTTEEECEWRQIRKNMAARVMSASFEALFEFKDPAGPLPGKARILSSLVCDVCGEATMESRTRRFQDQTLCIPCFEDVERRI